MLREELEYFSIPPRGGSETTNSQGIANDALLDLKKKCGEYLLHRRNIFTALQRNVNKENNLAEQHLIDMLCMRSVPSRRFSTVVVSVRRNSFMIGVWGPCNSRRCDAGTAASIVGVGTPRVRP